MLGQNLEVVERLSLFSFIWKHKYLFLFIIFTLPLIISSISESIKERNPSRPFLELGFSVISGDSAVYNDVQLLKNNPEELIGMSYPEIGIWNHVVYYWKFFWNVIWRILGEIFLISVPFFIFYYFFNYMNTSAVSKNIILAVLSSIGFMFITNLIILSYRLATGIIQLSLSGSNQFLQIWSLIKIIMPFHGIVSLISYLISIIV